MATIEQVTNQLEITPFPEFPEDDTLSDWVAELAEFDGYVAGMAMTAKAGGEVNVRQLSEQAKHFSAAFAQLPTTYSAPEDNEIYLACNLYLRLIENLVAAIREYRSC